MATIESSLDLNQTSGAVTGSVTGAIAPILRLEAGVALVLAVVLYHALGGSWWLFAVLFFVPDLSMLGLSDRQP